MIIQIFKGWLCGKVANNDYPTCCRYFFKWPQLNGRDQNHEFLRSTVFCWEFLFRVTDLDNKDLVKNDKNLHCFGKINNFKQKSLNIDIKCKK